jgi:predicted site-specific integrase-resolvase
MSEPELEWLKPKQAAAVMQVPLKTLRKYLRLGLILHRTRPTGHREIRRDIALAFRNIMTSG